MMNMFERAIRHMERDPGRVYSLTELRKATGIALRSQYKLSQQLLASGMVERGRQQQVEGGCAVHGYRFKAYLLTVYGEPA
jgi:hypothetical protein